MGLKQKVKGFLRTEFEIGQKLKFDILPRHFYSEIPRIAQLRVSTAWRRPRNMDYIAGADLSSQLAFAAACTKGLSGKMMETSIHGQACERNHLPEGFGPIEADFLYCFVRSQKPPCIIQVGCGVSTAVCLMAAEDEGYMPEIHCIEPYPTDYLIHQAAAGKLRLLREKFEDTTLPIASLLQDSGLFFVDSSHTLGPAGEVTQLICDVLPTLPSGAWVHFHDILFPYDYSPDILTTELFFSHESALLHAFLSQNIRYRVAASLSMLHHGCPAELAECLPNYRPAQFDLGLRLTSGDHPSSIYLQVP